ncbi:hypothetical protein MKW92_024663 [Papaver armeniacum]|nr:hypothetical protein MKW92_024663 [Papaver armeniacum]
MAQPTQPNKSALVVDDSQLLRKIHCRLLQSFGMQTREADNGLEAVKLLKSGEIFDVILMDYGMPDMTGAEATQTIRGMGVTSLVLGVSAESDGAIREEFMKSGLDHLFNKPLTRDDLDPWVTIRKD